MFRTVFPSNIRGTRLYIQQQAFAKQVLLSACLFWNDTLHVSDGLSVHHQGYKTVHTAVKQIHVQCRSKINQFDTLVHLVGFTIAIILRCTAL